MGKLLTAPAPLECDLNTPNGVAAFKSTFWEFLVASLNQKAPVGSLEQICEAKEVRAILKRAQESKSETITVEDAQFKLIHQVGIAHAIAQPAAIAIELVGFLYAMEPKSEVKNPGGVQDIDLTSKK